MNTHQTCIVCEERTGRCTEDSIFGHDGFGPLCERCNTALAAKFERMEALELEREVNRKLYGLLEKNVAESMSIIGKQRDELLSVVLEVQDKIQDGDAQGAVRFIENLLLSIRCHECNGVGQFEVMTKNGPDSETCHECGGSGFFPKHQITPQDIQETTPPRVGWES